MFMKTGKKLAIKSLLILLGAILAIGSVAGCGEEASKEPIIFADLGWDSALTHNQIAAFILENGYGFPPSEFVPGETIPLFAGLERGDVHVNMECWTENQQEAYDKAIAAGTVVDLGDNFWDNWQGWLVPTYMIERGDLPADISVQDIPQYWELFKDPEDNTKGRFYSCIPGWECELINEAKFTAYGLDDTYNIFLPGSGAALLASMVAAYEKEEPWFGYYWAPTPALGKYDMTPVKEPAYDEATWNDNYACDYPAVKVSILVNAEWHDSVDKKIIDFLTKYSTTTAQNNKVLAYILENEASYEEAAIYFLKEFEDVWTTWVPDDVAKKVKEALP
jgi:glycine betaine/proline transport system substrate-binding protein